MGYVTVENKWRGVLCMHSKEREMEVQMGGEGTEGDRRESGEEPSMQSREREIEMRMGGEGTEGGSEKGNLGGAVDWDGGGGRKKKIKRMVLS